MFADICQPIEAFCWAPLPLLQWFLAVTPVAGRFCKMRACSRNCVQLWSLYCGVIIFLTVFFLSGIIATQLEMTKYNSERHCLVAVAAAAAARLDQVLLLRHAAAMT